MREVVRLGLAVGLVAGVVFGFLRLGDRAPGVLAPGSSAPDFQLPALTGPPVELSALRGHLVLVNFWATWCAPCVAEMPSLDRLHRRLRDEGLVVLAVAVDEDADVLRRWVEARRLTLAILHDPRGRDVAARYGVSGYPVSFLVDRDGRVLENYVGPVEWDDPAAVAHYRGLLAGRGSDSGR